MGSWTVVFLIRFPNRSRSINRAGALATTVSVITMILGTKRKLIPRPLRQRTLNQLRELDPNAACERRFQ